jgi:hypothetical protein
MKIAAYQAPLLPSASMQALERIKHHLKGCEADGASTCSFAPRLLWAAWPTTLPRRTLLPCAPTQDSWTLPWRVLPVSASPLSSGFTEVAVDGSLYNSAVLFAGGKVCGIYR